MLGRARYVKEPKTISYEKTLCTVNYGEFVFGRLSWSRDTGVSEQKLRTLIKLLIADGMIDVVTKNYKYTIYKVVNYEKFNRQQTKQYQEELYTDNRSVTICQPSANHLPTAAQPLINKDNKDKQENKDIEKKKKKIQKEKKEKSDVFVSYTENAVLIDTLVEFERMRNTIKKPMTDRAKTMLVNELDKIGSCDEEKIAILNQSIMHCWQGIFPLRGGSQTKQTTGGGKRLG